MDGLELEDVLALREREAAFGVLRVEDDLAREVGAELLVAAVAPTNLPKNLSLSWGPCVLNYEFIMPVETVRVGTQLFILRSKRRRFSSGTGKEKKKKRGKEEKGEILRGPEG